MWPFSSKPKKCPHWKRDLSVVGDTHVGCRTCKRRVGRWPCAIISIKDKPTIPDVERPDFEI